MSYVQVQPHPNSEYLQTVRDAEIIGYSAYDLFTFLARVFGTN